MTNGHKSPGESFFSSCDKERHTMADDPPTAGGGGSGEKEEMGPFICVLVLRNTQGRRQRRQRQ